MKWDNILEAIGHTPLVEIQRLSPKESVRFYAKLEGQNPTGSVKDRIAKYMLEQAEASGTLTKDRIILEPTSGNTGIALAMIGRRKGYRVKVVMPDNVSSERVELLKLYGAEIVFTPGAEGTNGSICVACQMAMDERYFMPYQYGNEANPLAHYETTGIEILQDLPQVDAFVAGLGTGGTLMGTGKRLKEENPATRLVAVVPHPGEQLMGLRNPEDGFIPPILDLSRLDARMVVSNRDAFLAAKALAVQEGIFAGISSGAVLHAARKLAQRMERGNVVLLLADGGWKYLSSGIWTKDEPGDLDSQIWW